MSTIIELPPVTVDSRGVAIIEGTGFKVKHIAAAHRQGISLEDIREDHPDLTLDQISAALAFYYAHREILNGEMERDKIAYEAAWEAQNIDTAYQAHIRQLRERFEASKGQVMPQ